MWQDTRQKSIQRLYTANVLSSRYDTRICQNVKATGNRDSVLWKNKHIIYKHDEIIAKTVKNNTATLKPPKAWDKKFKEQFPEEWEKIRISREHAKERADKLKQELTDYTDKEMLEINKEKLLTKASMLPREL